MLNKFTKIYLVENCYGDPNKVYIGKEKSQQKQSREGKHRKIYGNLIKFTFIDQVNGWDRKHWKSIESFWINYFKFLGFEVLNKNKGGGGPEFHNEITKLKLKKPKPLGYGEIISKALKGKPKPKWIGENHSKLMRGRKVSENTKLKISLSSKNKPKHNKNSKHKISKALKNKSKPKGFGELISKLKTGIKLGPQSKETCEKKSKANKGKPKPKGFGNKISKYILQYDLNGDFIKEWPSIKDASENLKINRSSISNCLLKKSKSAGKYKWEYKLIQSLQPLQYL